MSMRVILEGIHLPECPRWHDGALWMCDVWGHEVLRIGEAGDRQLVHRFPDDEDAGGIGWLPDGRLLVVGFEGRVLYVLDAAGKVAVYADLRELAPYQLNDMIVAPDGTAYVSQFGWDVWGGGTYAPSTLLRVRPDRSAEVAADDMAAPNGIAITDDGRALVVAEPGAGRLSRFTVQDDGSLCDRRLIPIEPADGARLCTPDGICLDAGGGVWVADPLGARVVHIGADDRVENALAVGSGTPLACVLGGPDRRTLFVCVGGEHVSKPNRPDEPPGRLVAFEVDVPGTGRP